MSDMFDEDPTAQDRSGVNAPAYSVSELSVALKRTLEDAYGFVRVRGEVSKVTRHASGHIYLTIKDDKASIDGVVWRASAAKLGCRPEPGLEVLATGRITTYPARSSYQLIIDSLAPAGAGALLAQLERLKEKLRAEGLFDAARKRPLPAYPRVIAVVTSPTGAVIRDILHRISDRWPTRVLLWPVLVQGSDAAAQVARAVEGLNQLGATATPSPDVIIIARGGGSVEDLWPFNDERLARVVAASRTPIISAIGHETDVTLLDFVADRRAPTPTAAAELATPVMSDLLASLAQSEHRMLRAVSGAFALRRSRLSAAARGLPRPLDLIGLAAQRYDGVQGRLAAGLRRNLAIHERRLDRAASRLGPHLLDRGRQLGESRVENLSQRLHRALEMRMARLRERLTSVEQLRRSYNPDRPLSIGFARVHRPDGTLIRAAASLIEGEPIALVFGDGERTAHVDAPPVAPGQETAR